jgi:hypothetical protein
LIFHSALVRLISPCALALSALLLTGCGYPGEPLPPALKRPVRIVDLNAVERGSKLFIQFTIPTITTEGAPVKGVEPLDVRIGPPPAGRVDMNVWARDAQRIPQAQIKRSPPIATIEIDAAPFYNKTILLAARALSPKGDDAGWSNPVAFPVVPALPKPAGVDWKNAPDAVRLTWHAAAPQFRIFRKQSEKADYGALGTADKPEYLDTGITYGTTYDYLLQSIEKVNDERYAESDPTELPSVKPEDKFPPAVPGGLTAVPGAKSIELVWNRNTDRDFASYRIYRDGKLLAGNIVSLAYSDRDVKPGITYTYQLSAVDTAGNESQKSAPVSAALP